MKGIAAIALALISLGFGIVAAVYWYRSTRISIKPGWELHIGGDVSNNIMGWVSGLMIAFTAASRLNKLASIWTGASIVMAGASAVVSAWPY
jgi:hypothetical protein